MPKTIQTALAPLMIIGSFCSLGLIEYPFGQPKPCLTCSYLLITWSLFVCFFYHLSDIPFMYMSSTTNIMMISTIMSMLVSLFRFKELKMCLRKLSIVDDTLETLGTPKEYRRLRNRIIQIITGWIILSLLINAVDELWWNYNYFSIARICAPFLENHFFHVNNLSALTWAVILGYTSSRFQQVNEHIRVLYSDLLKDNVYCRRQNRLTLVSQRRIEAEECKQYMWIIMHVHLQLCLISRELNKVFSIQMILQMTSYFTIIVELCCEIYTFDTNKDVIIFGHVLDNAVAYFAGTLYSIIVITLNDVCQTVYYKANETIAILYKVLNNNLDENLREQILQFILQIKQKEVKFGMGLFYFGYDFIGRFYKSLVTILVILIQMGTSYKYILLN